MTSDRLSGLRWDVLRVGQRSAIERIIARYMANESHTSIILPTRYGKSDVMRFVVAALWLMGELPCALIVTPSVILRRQLLSKDDWRDSQARYGLPPLLIKGLDGWADLHNPNANGEVFLAASTQLMAKHADALAVWAESVRARTADRDHPLGKAPLIMVDECHTGSEDNSWGGGFQTIVGAGARGVLLTATAVRSDGKRLPGFHYEKLNEEAARYSVVRETDDPKKLRVEVYAGMRVEWRLVADHETSFKQAWTENALCKIERVPLDVQLDRIGIKADGGAVLLSQLTDQRESRTALARAVRDTKVIAESAAQLDQMLAKFRARDRGVGAMVFCGNDDATEPGINQHAEFIKAAIRRVNPSLRPVIATSAADENSAKAAAAFDTIEAFKAGVGDVLIVKQMAGLGFDCSRVKVLLDLSTIRTDAACMQRWTRPATPHEYATPTGTATILNCAILSPDDWASRDTFARWVTAQGGGFTTNEVRLVRDEEVERDPEKEKERPDFRVTDVLPGEFEDSDGRRAPGELWQPVSDLFAREPKLSAIFTHAEFASLMVGWKIEVPPAPEPAVRNTGEEADSLRQEINATVRSLALGMLPGRYDPSRSAEYAEASKSVFTALYRAGGVARGTSLREITDLAVLQRLLGLARGWQKGGAVREEVGVWLT